MRVVSHFCELPRKYQTSSHCRPFYTDHYANTSSFGPNSDWHHGHNGANGYQGKHGYYDNHGFVLLLTGNASGARNQLEMMQRSNWIDKHTRAVAVEFTLFHAPTSLFMWVSYLLWAIVEYRITSTKWITQRIRHLHIYFQWLAVLSDWCWRYLRAVAQRRHTR